MVYNIELQLRNTNYVQCYYMVNISEDIKPTDTGVYIAMKSVIDFNRFAMSSSKQTRECLEINHKKLEIFFPFKELSILKIKQTRNGRT